MAVDKSIKGLNIKLGADSTSLSKALTDVERASKDISKELSQVNRLLKFNPNDTTLLSQKQELLNKQIENTAERLKTVREAEKQAQAQFAQGKIGEEQYRAIQREVVETESKLKNLNSQLKEMDWKKVADGLDKFGKKATDVGKTLSATVTAPILAVGAASFKMAADLQDAFGATDQIFKSASEEVKTWADSLESYYGIAESEALTYANTMGAMLQNIGGLTEEEAAKQSQILVELAGDLTAMFGGTTESAIQALTGALKGNNSMLDNYGMGVNDATIKTKALEMGLYDGTGAMDLQTKQAATLALIMEQTADAQGQAAREAEGASGSMRALTTEIKNIATDIGEVLLPIITPFIQKIKELTEKFGELSPQQQETIVKIAALAAAIGPILILLGSMSTGLSSMITLFAPLVTGLIGGTTAVGGLSAAIAFITGPIGIAIAAITAIIAVGVLLYKNWDTIKEKALALWNYLKQKFEEIKTAIETPVKNAIETLKNINLFEIGKNMIQGLINGIKNMIGKVKETIGNIADTVTGGIKRALKIQSPSKVMEEMGEYTGEGFAVGIKKSLGGIEKQTNAMAMTPISDWQNNGPSSVNHSGVIRVEGVNNRNELMSVVDIVMDELRREVRI